MIHLYCGDGKGKTTAAMGLALRMAGRGKPVVIAQFLKGADSGERYALSLLPKVTLLPAPEQIKFSFQLTPEERAAEQKRYLRLIAQARKTGKIPETGQAGTNSSHISGRQTNFIRSLRWYSIMAPDHGMGAGIFTE